MPSVAVPPPDNPDQPTGGSGIAMNSAATASTGFAQTAPFALLRPATSGRVTENGLPFAAIGHFGRSVSLSAACDEVRSDVLGVLGVKSGSMPSTGNGRKDSGLAERMRLYACALMIAMTLVLTILAAGLWVREGLRLAGDIPPVVFPIVLAAAVAYAAAGTVIVIRRPERNVGWVLATLGLLVATVYLSLAFVSLERVGVIGHDTAAVAGVVSVSVVASATVAVGATFGFIFPTGHTRDRMGRWGLRLVWLGTGVIALGQLLSPGPIFILRDLHNPLDLGLAMSLGPMLLGLGVAVLMASSVLAAFSLVARYRASDATTRRQIRLVVGAAGTLALATFLFLAASYFGASGPLRDVITITLAAALLMSPVAILVAMTRYRLYELDHLVGRTLVIAGSTAILAGIFAATQRLLQSVFMVVLGESSDLTYVISTLIVVTSITPLKQHLESFVDAWEREEGESAAMAPVVTAMPTASGQDSLDPLIVAVIDTHIEQRFQEWLVVHGAPPVADVTMMQTRASPADASSDTRD